MSTYLQLAQRLRLEAGVSGTGPTTVVGNTNNEYARLCTWLADADIEIQSKYDDWRFQWSSFSFNTTASDGDYTETDVTGSASIAVGRYNFDSMRYFLTADTNVTEQWGSYWNYEAFRDRWRFGGSRATTGVPSEWTVAPDRTLLLGPLPDDIYTITGEFYVEPVRMTLDADTPRYPAMYHYLPMWWALVKYAGFEETSFVYTNAQNQLSLLWSSMERRERPTPSFGAPLV